MSLAMRSPGKEQSKVNSIVSEMLVAMKEEDNPNPKESSPNTGGVPQQFRQEAVHVRDEQAFATFQGQVLATFHAQARIQAHAQASFEAQKAAEAKAKAQMEAMKILEAEAISVTREIS